MREDEPAGAKQVHSIPQPRFVRSLPTVELPSTLEEIFKPRFIFEQLKRAVSRNSLSEAQDFNDLEKASSAVSVRAPSKP